MPVDPYKILGISKNASADEVKKAFHKLAHQHHPDKKGGDVSKFKEINEAYQILSDPQKRSQYDQLGFAGSGPYSGGQQGGFGGGGQGFGGFDFSDIFSRGGFRAGGQQGGFGGGIEDIFDLFSGGGGNVPRERESRKGEDIYLEVSLHQKDLGTKKIFEFTAHNLCDECGGKGYAKGSKLVDCSECKGSGQIRRTARTLFGSFVQVAPCPACKGKRKVPEKVCGKCRGQGRVSGKRKLELHLPDSLESGYSIVFPKQGSAGKEGKPSGDLLITLKMR